MLFVVEVFCLLVFFCGLLFVVFEIDIILDFDEELIIEVFVVVVRFCFDKEVNDCFIIFEYEVIGDKEFVLLEFWVEGFGVEEDLILFVLLRVFVLFVIFFLVMLFWASEFVSFRIEVVVYIEFVFSFILIFLVRV